jgi:uncharacterized protein YaiL (DUF2058 family)
MSKSLQDQLKALGLAKEPVPRPAGKKNQVPKTVSPQQPARQKKQPVRVKPAPAQAATEKDPSLEQAYVLREQQSRAEAEQSRERKRLEDLKRRQINNAIKAVVEPHRLNDPAAELARHFMYKGRIRKVNVTLEQFKALNEGELGLVYLSGGYHLLLTQHVLQVRALAAEHVPDLSGGAEEEEQYPVPDDLIW